MNRKTANDLLNRSTLERDLALKLVSEILNISQNKFFGDKNTIIVSRLEERRFNVLQAKIQSGVPFQYAIGKANFYGREFTVNGNVLIPRPETELLVEQALKFIKLKVHKVSKVNTVNILDLGTGSGCIAVSLYCELARNTKYEIRNTKYEIRNTKQT